MSRSTNALCRPNLRSEHAVQGASFGLVFVLTLLMSCVFAPLRAEDDRAELLRKRHELGRELTGLLKRSSVADQKVQDCLSKYASVLFDLGDYKAALKHYKILQKGQRKTLAPAEDAHIHTLLRIAECHAASGDDKKARKVAETVLKRCRSHPDDDRRLHWLEFIGPYLHEMGQYELGAKTFKELHDECVERLGPEHAKSLLSALGYSACQIELNNGKETIPFIQKTLALYEKHHPDDVGYKILRHNLAALYLGMAKYSEAKDILEPLMEKLDEDELSPSLVRLHKDTYARTLTELGEYEKALAIIESLIAELERNAKRHKDEIADLQELRKRCKKGQREKS